MLDFNKVAAGISQSLQTRLAPIAVKFCDNIPPQASVCTDKVAAGCEFWEKAATGMIATSAGDHANCAIGVHTHNLADASDRQASELGSVIAAMSGLDYVREEEVAAIPVLEKQVKHVVYGPLADFEESPDVVLLFVDAQQGLVLSEAAARIDGNMVPAMGRPACAMLPQVLNSGNAALSLGCCGARAYLQSMDESIALWALPASKLAAYAREIDTLASANTTLTAFHQRRQLDILAGDSPSVTQSLERM